MKIFSRSIFGLIVLSLLLYFSLWIYISNFVPKELKYKYNQNIESNFSDEQYHIISFSLSGEKTHKFKWYPFIIDFFVVFTKEYNSNYESINTIAAIAASAIAGEYFNSNLGRYTTMDWHIMNYGFIRYLIVKNDYKKCIDIIMEECFLGENIYGIKNGSKRYFNKEINELSNEELVSLIVLFKNPTRYKMETEENKNRTVKILNEYNILTKIK
jgi:hypothetical protein